MQYQSPKTPLKWFPPNWRAADLLANGLRTTVPTRDAWTSFPVLSLTRIIRVTAVRLRSTFKFKICWVYALEIGGVIIDR